jgi:hypothetical protein
MASGWERRHLAGANLFSQTKTHNTKLAGGMPNAIILPRARAKDRAGRMPALPGVAGSNHL